MDLPALRDFIVNQPLLALAAGGIVLSMLGALFRGASPAFGRLLSGTGHLGLIAALLLTIAQVARINGSADLSLPQIGLPDQEVSGQETRIAMGRDGHFWLRAKVNGVPRRFLVDTGATLTAVSPETAAAAAIEKQQWRRPIILRTANGAVTADLGTIRELRFGNVVARDLDTVIAPGLGRTDVVGMNLLSRLASWRVEGRTLILVPKHPQETDEETSGKSA